MNGRAHITAVLIVCTVFFVSNQCRISDVPRGRAGISIAGIYPVVLLVGIPAAVLYGYNVITGKMATSPDSHDRNPQTGVIAGAEAFSMGPADSRYAALLIHGYIGSARDFGPLPGHLASMGWYVHALRLPGHGTFPDDFSHVTADSLIDAVATEFATLREKHQVVVVIGHSMGGSLAAITAAQQPVDGLVLAAPYFGVTRHWYYLLPPETWAVILDPFVRWVYKGESFIQLNRQEAKREIISYEWVPVSSVHTLSELGTRARSSTVLDEITCPVLLLHAHGDNAASPDMSAEAFQRIGSSRKRFVWLENSNHIIFWDYDRDTVLQEITRFLRSLE